MGELSWKMPDATCCVGCSLLVHRMGHEMSNGRKIIDSIDAATSHWVPNDYLDGQ